jgi:hypothetical protein
MGFTVQNKRGFNRVDVKGTLPTLSLWALFKIHRICFGL